MLDFKKAKEVIKLDKLKKNCKNIFIYFRDKVKKVFYKLKNNSKLDSFKIKLDKLNKDLKVSLCKFKKIAKDMCVKVKLDKLGKLLKNACIKLKLDKLLKMIKHALDRLNKSKYGKYKKYLPSAKETVLVIILCFMVLAVRTYNSKEVLTSLVISDNKAEAYFLSGNYEKALEEYDKIAEGNTSAQWEVDKAEIYSVKQDYENSRKHLSSAKKILNEQQNKDVNIINHLIFTEFMNKDYGVALIDGEEALRTFPNNNGLIKTMFTIYMANNQMENASSLIERYDVNVKSAYDIAEYARMLMIVNKWDEGFSELSRAWEIDKDELKVYDVLAQISVYNKDLLLQNISQLSDKYPNNPAYKMWLAKIYSLGAETSEHAKDLINEVEEENRGKIISKLIEVKIFENSNAKEEADSLIKSLLDKYPKDYRVLHAVGWYYADKKEYDKALEFCQKGILANKNYPDNYGFLMPEILKGQGKSIEGEPYFRKALYKEPYNYNIMLNIANYYWFTTKNTSKAMEYFKFAEIVKPLDAEIKYNMASIHLSNDRIDDAVLLLKECIKIDDMVPKYHRTLGTIYMKQGKTTEAIKEIRYAYSADEQDILTLNNAGCYYVTIDANLDRALTNFQAAFDGIKPGTDQYTSDTIKENYDKFKKLYDKYKNSRGNETLTIPEFILFY